MCTTVGRSGSLVAAVLLVVVVVVVVVVVAVAESTACQLVALWLYLEGPHTQLKAAGENSMLESVFSLVPS